MSGKVNRSGAALAVLAIYCLGCAPRPKDVTGSYLTAGEFKSLVLEVRSDGSYTLYDHDPKGSVGQWHLNEHKYFDTGIELDGASYSDEYRLTKRFGALCIEIRRDHEYWCKTLK